MLFQPIKLQIFCALTINTRIINDTLFHIFEVKNTIKLMLRYMTGGAPRHNLRHLCLQNIPAEIIQKNEKWHFSINKNIIISSFKLYRRL